MESGKTRTWEPKLFFLFVCLSVCLHIPSSLVIPSVFTKHFFQFFFFIHFSFFFICCLFISTIFSPLFLFIRIYHRLLRCVRSFLIPIRIWLFDCGGSQQKLVGCSFFFRVCLFIFFFFCCPSRFGNLATLKIGFGDYFFCWRIFARFNRWSQIVRFIRANFKWIGVQFFSQWPKIGFKWDFGLDFKVSSQKIGENLVILSTILKPFVYFWWTFSSFSVGFQLIGRKLVLNDIFC